MQQYLVEPKLGKRPDPEKGQKWEWKAAKNHGGRFCYPYVFHQVSTSLSFPSS